ncbi:hypothetical protein CHS0354_015417 [Potamilus streckersoni]|uniref:BTB domain-containing protein n=1 Tax=Potamilus streckersoni TaxID=2493646 RepID=A0AAE0S0Q2_9BIVA|nr:hypothetical protein CHS0354_015417 [Potamilus streckersoni]
MYFPILISSKYKPEDYPVHFFKMLKEFRRDEVYCDIKLVVGSKIFPAHRIILMACGPYFKAMLMSGMAEISKDSITILGVEPDVFQIILDFIYTGELEVNEDTCEDLLAAADMFSLTDVVTVCSMFLKDRLQPHNCLGINMFAEIHACTDLVRDSERYISSNFLKVQREEEYKNLPLDRLLHYLYSENLRIENEFQVFIAAMDWIKHDQTMRKKHIFEVMSPIRFPLISQKQLDGYLETQDDISIKVALQKILKDFRLEKKQNIEKKACKLKPFHSRPRKCARKNIYVIGGFSRPKGGRWSDAQTLSIVERFDTFHQQWYTMPSIQYARSSHGVGVVNGCICVVGGENDSLIYDSVESYDSVTHEWMMLPGMTTPRCGLGVCTLDNYLFALGGWVGSEIGDTIERYDPDQKKWAVVGKMTTLRFAMGVVGEAGLLFVIGGMSDLGSELQLAETFNPAFNEWRRLPDMQVKRAYAGVAALDGCIYVAGGWNDLDGALSTVERYCPETNEWTMVSPMGTVRAAASVAVVNGLLYAIGGRSFTDEFTAPVTMDTVECYDPIIDRWTDVGFMPTSRCEATAVVL